MSFVFVNCVGKQIGIIHAITQPVATPSKLAHRYKQPQIMIYGERVERIEAVTTAAYWQARAHATCTYGRICKGAGAWGPLQRSVSHKSFFPQTFLRGDVNIVKFYTSNAQKHTYMVMVHGYNYIRSFAIRSILG